MCRPSRLRQASPRTTPKGHEHLRACNSLVSLPCYPLSQGKQTPPVSATPTHPSPPEPDRTDNQSQPLLWGKGKTHRLPTTKSVAVDKPSAPPASTETTHPVASSRRQRTTRPRKSSCRPGSRARRSTCSFTRKPGRTRAASRRGTTPPPCPTCCAPRLRTWRRLETELRRKTCTCAPASPRSHYRC